MTNDSPHPELSRIIIESAMNVLNTLKPGLDEKLHERAMVIELSEQGLTVEQQRQYPVHYKGKPIGTLIPDLIVDGKVIVDTKVSVDFNDSHSAQMLGYLTITGLSLGLLLNFKYARLGIKRIANS